jgi:hypothetical protein
MKNKNSTNSQVETEENSQPQSMNQESKQNKIAIEENNQTKPTSEGAKPTTEGNQADCNKNCFWASVALFAAGLILLVVSIFVTALGFYGIFASMILELASLTFLNSQKKHGYFLACKIFRVLSYIVMLSGIAVILGFIIISI